MAIALNWLAAPPRRARALVAALGAGLAAGVAATTALGLGTWGAFGVVVIGFVVASVVFGAVSAAGPCPPPPP